MKSKGQSVSIIEKFNAATERQRTLNSEISDLEENLPRYQEEMINLDRERIGVEKSLTSYNNELTIESLKFSFLTIKKNALSEKLQEEEVKSKLQDQQVRKIEAELTILRNNKETKSQKINQRIIEFQSMLSSLEIESKTTEDLVAFQKSRENSFLNNIKSLKQKKEFITNKLQELAQQKSKTANDFNSSLDALSSSQEEQIRNLDAAKAENERLKSEADSLESNLRKAKSSFQKARDKLANVKQARNLAEAEVKKALEDLKFAKRGSREAKKYAEKAEEIRKRVEKLDTEAKKAYDEKIAQENRLANELNTFKKRVVDRGEVNRLAALVLEQSTKIETIQRIITERERSLEGLKKSLEDSKASLSEYQKASEKYQREIKKLNSQYTAKLMEAENLRVIEESRQTLNNNEKKLKRLNNQAGSLQIKKKKLRQEFNMQNNDWSQTRRNNLDDIKDIREILQQKEKELKDKNKQMQEVAEIIEIKDNLLKSKQQDLQYLSRQRSSLTSDIDKQSSLHSKNIEEIKILNIKIKKNKSILTAHNESQLKVNEQLSNAITEKERLLESKSAELSVNSQDIKKLDSLILDLNGQINKTNQDFDIKVSSIESLSNALKEQRYKNNLDRLTLYKLEQEKTKTAGELAEVRREISSLQAKSGVSSTEIERLKLEQVRLENNISQIDQSIERNRALELNLEANKLQSSEFLQRNLLQMQERQQVMLDYNQAMMRSSKIDMDLDVRKSKLQNLQGKRSGRMAGLGGRLVSTLSTAVPLITLGLSEGGGYGLTSSGEQNCPLTDKESIALSELTSSQKLSIFNKKKKAATKK